MTNVGNAVIELAVTLGAIDVYATGKPRHFSDLEALGATPIDRKPKLWPAAMLGIMDLVIDATGDVSGEHANVSHFNALHDQGVLIFIGLRDMTDVVAREWDVTSTLLAVDNTDDLVNRTHSLEVFDNWELDLDRSKVRNVLSAFCLPCLILVLLTQLIPSGH
jgi:NADPH:quinone reductase-like Zn-dependent oxidoreductase